MCEPLNEGTLTQIPAFFEKAVLIFSDRFHIFFYLAFYIVFYSIRRYHFSIFDRLAI